MDEEYTNPNPHTERTFTPSPPKELVTRAQFVNWKLVQREDKLDKVPFQSRWTRRCAKTSDPSTWSTFSHAEAVRRQNPAMDGVGFVFSETDPFCGIDFDDCRDPVTGEVDPYVEKWLEALGGYQEVSPSGYGVHCIVKAKLPGEGRKRVLKGRKIEIYDRRRFFTYTGQRLSRRVDFADVQATVTKLYELLSPPKRAQREVERLTAPILTDDEILQKARTARNGWRFAKLFDEGAWESFKRYASQSEADAALIHMLIFWTAGDRDRVVELFESSALYRAREKRGDYVERTVDNCLSAYDGPFYNPDAKRRTVEDSLRAHFRLLDASSFWKGGKLPSARKALAALVLAACEHGQFHGDRGIVIGVDIRTLESVSHMSNKTLLSSALPTLVKLGLVRWIRKDKSRRNSGAFLLPFLGCAKLHHSLTTLISGVTSHAYKNDLGIHERKELLRASVGRSKKAAITCVGNAKQVLLEHLVGSAPNRLTLEELAERTGRERRYVRRDMRALLGLNLIAEDKPDEYRLDHDFWFTWLEVLEASGVTERERLREQRHKRDRKARYGERVHV